MIFHRLLISFYHIFKLKNNNKNNKQSNKGSTNKKYVYLNE